AVSGTVLIAHVLAVFAGDGCADDARYCEIRRRCLGLISSDGDSDTRRHLSRAQMRMDAVASRVVIDGVPRNVRRHDIAVLVWPSGQPPASATSTLAHSVEASSRS